MSPVFRNALISEPRFQCLRLLLQPLTLGHLFLLQSLESPLLTPGAAIETGDLVLGVAVCSRSYQQAARLLRGPWWSAVWLWYWGFRCRQVDFWRELGVFFAYLHDARRAPATSTPANGGTRALMAPLEWRTYELLTARGWTREQALNTPVAEALCLWAVRKEDEGKVQLVNESELSRLWRKSHS